MEKRRKRRLIAIVCLLLIAAGFALRPWYKNYIKREHIRTCAKARFYVCCLYEQSVEGGAEPGLSLAEQLIRDKFEYVAIVSSTEDAVTVTGMCLEGGTCTFSIDPESDDLSAACNEERHKPVDRHSTWWQYGKY